MIDASSARIHRLATAAMEAMQEQAAVEGATADEVLSACMTIAHRTVQYCRENVADMSDIRNVLQVMLLESILPTDQRH